MALSVRRYVFTRGSKLCVDLFCSEIFIEDPDGTLRVPTDEEIREHAAGYRIVAVNDEGIA